MPVVNTSIVSYLLIRFFVNMEVKTATVAFQKFIDEEPDTVVEFQVTGNELLNLLNTYPVAGKTRGDDITDLIYQYAIDHNIISGSIAS